MRTGASWAGAGSAQTAQAARARANGGRAELCMGVPVGWPASGRRRALPTYAAHARNARFGSFPWLPPATPIKLPGPE